MKKINKFSAFLICSLFAAACTYDFPDFVEEPTQGEADFSKMISVGNSLTAGFMNGALYTASQDNSFVSIIAAQMQLVGGSTTFNQPSVNSTNGCYNPSGGCTAGRLYLKIGGSGPAPTPKPGDGGAALAPLSAAAKAALNNFGVPGVTIQTALLVATGGPAASNPYYNPYYARIASNPSVDGVNGSTLVGDAAAELADGGTFFTFWLGNNDVLGYATGGGAGAPPTAPATFTAAYNTAINAMLNANANATGAVGNIPDVTVIPFFTTVSYKPIPLDAATAGALNAGLATPYNNFLNAMVGASAITAAERDKRLLNYVTGNNSILIEDETLTDLTAAMNANGASALVPYAKARHTKSTDYACLTAASYIGIDLGGGAKNGVNATLRNPANALKGDDLILIPTEITEVQTAVSNFNATIAAAVSANSGRLVLVDANAALSELRNTSVTINGSAITASITPPNGAFSLDGVHPNARGSAYMANVFIKAINGKFKSNIPLCNPNAFGANELPVP